MSLIDRLARAQFFESYPDWPEERWTALTTFERSVWLSIARRTRRVMAKALRSGDDLGNGLTARAR